MLVRGICFVGLLVTAALFGARPTAAQPSSPGGEWGSSANVAMPPGLPPIGKWMLTRQNVPADWLGEVYQGKNLREPVNVIIVDEAATSAEDAKARLTAAAARAGYPVRFGHSAGYQAYLGGYLYAQLPEGRDDAFSNNVFEVNNNHGRIFGPHRVEEVYVFSAALSRENVAPFRAIRHRYASFDRARDDFTQSLDRATNYKISGFAPLDNALIGDSRLSTGDHDGMAVVLHARK